MIKRFKRNEYLITNGNILILLNLHLYIIIKTDTKYYSLSSYIILNIIIKHLKILYLILIIQFWFKRIINIILNIIN